jgi:hypothetical protein
MVLSFLIPYLSPAVRAALTIAGFAFCEASWIAGEVGAELHHRMGGKRKE